MSEARGARIAVRGHGAWRRALPGAVLALTTASAALAQTPAATPHERAPAAVRWGKWGAAALFAGMTAYGASLHNRANGDYRALIAWCQGGGGSCLLGPDGTYADPRSEQLYQSSLDGDRAARAWLIAGQVALVGAVVLFVTELQYTHGPENIPFEPRLEVMPAPGGSRVGLRLIALPFRGP